MPHYYKDVQTLIIGAGVMGLSLAKSLQAAGQKKILILEKEPDVAKHASGRNSGVLHAGIYYPSDSLKAKYSLAGNRHWTQYCKAKGLPYSQCGKFIVASNASERETLEQLYEQAKANGASVSLVSEAELAQKEPLATTHDAALFSPETGVVDPKAIMQALKAELLATGDVEILTNTRYLGRETDGVIHCTKGQIRYEYFINAAGGQAIEVAHDFDQGLDYQFLPFKGVYKQLSGDVASQIRHHIYPVPDLKFPFLGVHFTKSVGDTVWVGPTAIPALSAENYKGLQGLSPDTLRILGTEARMFLQNKSFRSLAMRELCRYYPKYFYEEAKTLVPSLPPSAYLSSDKAGIRPQLIRKGSGELVMDFCSVQSESELHILNAISPAFTAAPAFADAWVAA